MIIDITDADTVFYLIAGIAILIMILLTLTILIIKEKPSKRITKLKKKPKARIVLFLSYDVFFLIGLGASVFGFLKRELVIFIIGVCLMIFSLPLLELVLKKKAGMYDEKRITEKVNEILKREKELDKREMKLKKEVDIAYQMAVELEKKKVKLKGGKKGVIPEDIKKVLIITDELLGKLPEEEVEEFVASKDFQLYKRVMKQVKR